MERRIEKHATRLSAALDQEFSVGQRVRTLDGAIGRVILVTESFSPGNTEYQVILDNGMGGGTFLGNQLRPVGEGYGGGHQAPAYLPAGVTAALEAEADLESLASHWYPEMGTILEDRPDPGRQISMIGSRHTAVPLPYSQEKLFHMQHQPHPDCPECGWNFGERDPEVTFHHVKHVQQARGTYEPEECEHCGGDLKDRWEHEEHHSNWLGEQDWYTDWNAEGPGDTLHRGIATRLPPELHEHMHDESVPVHQRARALAGHILRDQAAGSPHGGLGNFWSDEPDVSKSYAENTTIDRYRGKEPVSHYQTPVMLHAHFPGMQHVETDPDTLEYWGVHSYHKTSNREVPIQNQAPMRIKGISWAKPDHGLSPRAYSGVPEHLDEDPAWTHHEFGGEGIRAHAAMIWDHEQGGYRHAAEGGTYSTDHNQAYHPGPVPRLYHGTNHAFSTGDHVEPGHPTHYPEAYEDDEHQGFVHATPSVATAWQHADNAVHEHGGSHHVYEVSPTGPVTWGDETFPEDFEDDDEMNREGNRMSRHPFRVERELPYQGEPLPFTQRHHLAATYADGEDPREQDYNGAPEVGGVFWGAPAQQQFVDDELGQPEPGPVEMMPGEEPEEEGGEPPFTATAVSAAEAAIRHTATDWHAFDTNHDYRRGHVDGANGETADRDEAQARIDVARPYPGDIDYLAGHDAGTERGRELAAGQHDLGELWKSAPEYGAIRPEASWQPGEERDIDRWNAQAGRGRREEKSDRWHEYNQQYRPSTVHRGIVTELPDHLHDYVHDESIPREDRARALSEHFADQGGLGRHWTPHTQIAHRAIWNAADIGHGYQRWEDQSAPRTDVMFHVKRPGRRNEIRDPRQLEEHEVGWGYSRGEDETFLKGDSPLQLEGISWKEHEPEYPNEPFEHVDFPKPMRHTAAMDGEHETWYHITDNPKFDLDPEHAPQDNSLSISPREGTGLYLTKTPESWVNGHDYVRPYVAEIHAHPSVHEHEDSRSRWGGEMFVPSEHFGKLHVHRVIPIDAHAREEYGEHGWIESHHGTEFDTGNPIPQHKWDEPYRQPFPGYHYDGPDVRDMPKKQTNWHKKRALDYLQGNRGFDRETVSDLRRAWASVQVKHARVPWTPHQRELLHSWQDHPTATEGDFVDSRQFTNRYPEPAPGPDPETEFAEAVGPRAFTEMTARLAAHPPHDPAAETVYQQLAKDYPPGALSWIHDARWEGPHYVPLDQVDFSGRDGWEASGDEKGIARSRKKIEKRDGKGERPKPAVLVQRPSNPAQLVADGHHRALAEEQLAGESEEPRKGLWSWTGHVEDDEGPWDHMHDTQDQDQYFPPPDDSLEDGEPAAAPPQQQPVQPLVQRGLPPMSQGPKPGPRTQNYTPVEQSPSFQLAHPELQQQQEPPPGEEGDEGEDEDPGTDQALDSFEKAAGSAPFRFEFTAAWRDVVAKAERIVRENGVRITALAGSLTVGEVKGDHATYETGLQYYPGRGFSVMAYSCGCPWATFWQNPDQPGRFAGRMCSHAYALGLEARKRGTVQKAMFPELSGWPETVVVKSEPPWHPSDKSWAREWRAPQTTRPVLSSLIAARLDDEALMPVPAVTAARVLIDAGDDPAAVTALLRLAGLELTADQVNAPWGSQDLSNVPPQKPYGATEPPKKDMDPGSYGFLAGPDPDNWGEIADNSAIQQPLTNEAARASEDDNVLDLPAVNDWADEGQSFAYQDKSAKIIDNPVGSSGNSTAGRTSRRGTARQGTGPVLDTEAGGAGLSPQAMDTDTGPVTHEWGESFPYADRGAAGGPSTSLSPRDPQGLRMEEVLGEPQPDGALAELKDEPEPALDPEGVTAADPSQVYAAQVGAGISGQAQYPDQFTTQNPGMGSMDEPSVPDDSSIQTMGQQQWSGVDYNSGDLANTYSPDEHDVEPENLEDVVAAFQRSAASRQYAGGGGPAGDSDIAAAARAHLAKTADVLPADEADELIREGRGTRARNLDLLDLAGTHYTDEPALDDHDDDVLYA